MNSETPAYGIMKTASYKNAETYQIACDCHSPDHNVDMWIEINKEDDLDLINVSFYTKATASFWTPKFNRFKLIWEILTTGYYQAEHHLILSEQAARNMADTIISQVNSFNK